MRGDTNFKGSNLNGPSVYSLFCVLYFRKDNRKSIAGKLPGVSRKVSVWLSNKFYGIKKTLT